MSIKQKMTSIKKMLPALILLAIAVIFLLGSAFLSSGGKAPEEWYLNLEELTESIEKNRQDGQSYLSSIEEHQATISGEWDNYQQYLTGWADLNTQITTLKEQLANPERDLPYNFEDLSKGFKHSNDSIEVFRRESERSIFSQVLFHKDELIRKLQQKQKDLEELSAKKTEIIETLLAENDSLSREIENLQSTVTHLLKREEITKQEIDELISDAADSKNTSTKTKALIVDLQSREKQLLEEKEHLEAKIANYQKISCELASKSFNARYWIKEGKQKGKLVELDKIFKHKRRLIKKIEVEFMLCDNMINSTETPKLLVELTDAAGNLIQSKDERALDIQSTQATAIFSLDRRLKKGGYYFLVSENGIPLFEYEFNVD